MQFKDTLLTKEGRVSYTIPNVTQEQFQEVTPKGYTEQDIVNQFNVCQSPEFLGAVSDIKKEVKEMEEKGFPISTVGYTQWLKNPKVFDKGRIFALNTKHNPDTNELTITLFFSLTFLVKSNEV